MALASLDALLADAVRRNVTAALAEDLGADGRDLTAELIPADRAARARIVTREAGVLCGRPWAEEACRQVDPRIHLAWQADDGAELEPGQMLAELTGPARGLLSAERTLLNFLQLLSGTATLAARYVAAVSGTTCTVLDTRKTLPGLRIAQKYAVRCGGAQNHRLGLFDAFLIKENHIAAAGSIAAAVARAREIAADRPVEVEVETADELEQALTAGADIVMLDNFDLDATRAAVLRTAGRARLEGSGGITLATIFTLAATGVDYISVGELTKRVEPLDLSMRFES